MEIGIRVAIQDVDKRLATVSAGPVGGDHLARQFHGTDDPWLLGVLGCCAPLLVLDFLYLIYILAGTGHDVGVIAVKAATRFLADVSLALNPYLRAELVFFVWQLDACGKVLSDAAGCDSNGIRLIVDDALGVGVELVIEFVVELETLDGGQVEGSFRSLLQQGVLGYGDGGVAIELEGQELLVFLTIQNELVGDDDKLAVAETEVADVAIGCDIAQTFLILISTDDVTLLVIESDVILHGQYLPVATCVLGFPIGNSRVGVACCAKIGGIGVAVDSVFGTEHPDAVTVGLNAQLGVHLRKEICTVGDVGRVASSPPAAHLIDGLIADARSVAYVLQLVVPIAIAFDVPLVVLVARVDGVMVGVVRTTAGVVHYGLTQCGVHLVDGWVVDAVAIVVHTAQQIRCVGLEVLEILDLCIDDFRTCHEKQQEEGGYLFHSSVILL